MITRIILASLAALGVACAVSAQDGPSFALRASRIMPVDPELPSEIENGVIIVRDGRIVSIGTDLDIPYDLQILDLGDATIVPGFIDAASSLGGSHAGVESISGAYRAVDAFDRYREYETLLESGVTTVHVDPGRHRLVSGRGAIVKLGGYYDQRIISANADLAINLLPSVFNPPNIQHLLIPPSGDQPLRPSETQRPSSRLGMYLALREALHASGDDRIEFDPHRASFRNAWNEELPLRITADRSEDLSGAVQFLQSHKRSGYIVGGIELASIAETLRGHNVPLVYTVNLPFGTNSNIGEKNSDPLLGDINDLKNLDGVSFALSATGTTHTLRLAAATARRAGLSSTDVLAAITLKPAEILGVADRVGSLSPGKDADFLVMSGDPLETRSHVNRVYVNGHLVYRSDQRSDSVVVRGGTIWLGPDNHLQNGSILIEDGKIVAVGKSVPHPPGASVIDAGPDSFIAPGLIDAHGHLSLNGDRSSLPPQLSLARLVGAPRADSIRVARAGVTTVITAPYALHTQGSQLSAIKTAGESRDARVVSSTAALAFSVRGLDPNAIPGRFKSRIDAGKKYLEKWTEYQKQLAEWKKTKNEGKSPVEKPKVEETEKTEKVVDPISGTWSMRVFGGPLPNEVEGLVGLKLSGNQIEGRVTEPAVPVEHRIVGTLDGNVLSGTIELDTGGMGTPTWEAELTEPDKLSGTIQLQMFTINVEGRRTDKGPVEFKVVRSKRRTTGKDGRPLPPQVDEALEPVRAWLEKRIPAVIEVSTTQEIDAVLDALVDKQELPVVFLNADNAAYQADRLREKNVGVVVPANIMRLRNGKPYLQADDLVRRGVTVAFQSNAEDGARQLPLVGLYAVERGMSAENALAAMTIDVARMYKLENRIGQIKPGCDGDLVIFSGYPFETSSRVERVIINGHEVKN